MAVKSKANGKKRRNPTDPPPSPPGDGSPLSREYWRKRAAEIPVLKARIAELTKEDAERDAEGGVVTAERMRRVMGQPREMDRGPTEARLREWLDKDVKGYKGDMERQSADEQSVSALRSELDKLKAKLAAIEKTADVGADEGSDEADGLIQKILLERKGEL